MRKKPATSVASGIAVLAFLLALPLLAYGQEIRSDLKPVAIKANPSPPEVGQTVALEWGYGPSAAGKAQVRFKGPSSDWRTVAENVTGSSFNLELTHDLLGADAPAEGRIATCTVRIVSISASGRPREGQYVEETLQVRARNRNPVIRNVRTPADHIGGQSPEPVVEGEVMDPDGDPVTCFVEAGRGILPDITWTKVDGEGGMPRRFPTGSVTSDTVTRFRLVARDSRGGTSYHEFNLVLKPVPAPRVDPPPVPRADPPPPAPRTDPAPRVDPPPPAPRTDPAPRVDPPPPPPPAATNHAPTDLEIAPLATSVVSGQPLAIRWAATDSDAGDELVVSKLQRLDGPAADVAFVTSSARDVVSTTALVNSGTNPARLRLRLTVSDKAGATVSGVITITVLPVPSAPPPPTDPVPPPPVVAEKPAEEPVPPPAPPRAGTLITVRGPNAGQELIRRGVVQTDGVVDHELVLTEDGTYELRPLGESGEKSSRGSDKSARPKKKGGADKKK